jgi:hypothetical protein
LSKIGSYEIELINLSPKKWEHFLKEHSDLPGTRANIELAKAFARIGTLMDFKKYIRLKEYEAPENTPESFLVFCGVLGLGKYLSRHHDAGLLQELKHLANDPRWRIREAVSMALQTVGRKKISRLMEYAKSWVEGSYYEQRAAITALCEADLLTNKNISLEVLDLLDWVTATMIEKDELQDGEYEVLKKALSYCWSVAVAAYPEKGKPMMERWIKEKHPVVNRIMKENLKKQRLQKIDPEWTGKWLSILDE